jgi:glycerophosphoryl diester phosphodiesterase
MPPRDLFLDLTARPVIAHRGASGLRPENTLAAFLLACSQGADGLEFDVHLSADGVPVVHHDPTLDRTTNLRGPASLRTAAELARADAGGGEHVPTLAEVLEATGDLPVLIELKVPAVAIPLLETVRRLGALGRVALASFHPAALAPLRGSGLPLGATRPEIARAWAAAALGWPAGAVAWQFYAVPDRYRDRLDVPTRRFVRRARRQGCPVHVWTVDEPARAIALWRDGVAGILTNRPDLILAARDRAADPLVEER